MIFNGIIGAIYVPNAYIIGQKYYVVHTYGGHFEYYKLLKGGNMPPTWNCKGGFRGGQGVGIFTI